MATQILGRVRLVFKGAYNAGTTYQKLDTVHHEGIAYSAVSGGFSGVTPGSDATKWAVIIDTGTNPGLIARLDSDTAKLSSLSAAIDTNAVTVTNLRADVDSDTVKISNLSAAVNNLRADRDSEHGLIISKINQVADSDFIMGQLNPKITEIIARLDSDTIAVSAVNTAVNQLNPKITEIRTRLDSDTVAISAIKGALNSGYTFPGGITITAGQAFNFDSLAFTDAHKLEIRNTSNSVVFGGYVLDTDSNKAN